MNILQLLRNHILFLGQVGRFGFPSLIAFALAKNPEVFPLSKAFEKKTRFFDSKLGKLFFANSLGSLGWLNVFCCLKGTLIVEYSLFHVEFCASKILFVRVVLFKNCLPFERDSLFLPFYKVFSRGLFGLM